MQPVKTAPSKWDVLMSCPRYPLKNYVLALSLSGVRPGIPLKDGRTIHIVPDGYTLWSISGALKPFFNGGSGRLDLNGEAKGSIDLSLLGKLNIPIWMQLIVLDASAPGGIGYIPDPYVMRV